MTQTEEGGIHATILRELPAIKARQTHPGGIGCTEAVAVVKNSALTDVVVHSFLPACH